MRGIGITQRRQVAESTVEARQKEGQALRLAAEQARVFSLLDELDVTAETRELVRRWGAGEWSLGQLESAIGAYLARRQKLSGVSPKGAGREGR